MPYRLTQNKTPYEKQRLTAWRYAGIEIESFNEFRNLCILADWCCEICASKISLETACLDHNHITHKPRGVLCNMCNASLYWFEKRRRGYLMSQYPEQSERYLLKYGSEFSTM